MYRILSISRDGEQALAGGIEPRRCARCSAEWAHLHLLDGYAPIPQAEWPARFDALVLEQGASRTGLHYARIGADFGPPRLSLRPRRDSQPPIETERRLVFSAPIELRPAIYAQQPVAVWRRDKPFGHDAAAVQVGQPLDIGEPIEVAECTLCYADRLMDSPIRQGHLYLARVADTTRLYTVHQPGVEDVAASPGPDGECFCGHPLDGHDAGCSRDDCVCIHPCPAGERRWWFNHQFPAEQTALLTRGQIGALIAEEPFTITSRDHPPVSVEAGQYDLYHPWPRRDSRGNGD